MHTQRESRESLFVLVFVKLLLNCGVFIFYQNEFFDYLKLNGDALYATKTYWKLKVLYIYINFA